MFKKIAAMLAAALFAISSLAAVEANKGTAADLDGLKGVGPALSKRIIDARAQGEFKDWADFMQRVKGVKAKSATKLSAEGLTINGQAYAPAAGADESKKRGKKAEAAASAAAPAAMAAPASMAAAPAAAPAAASAASAAPSAMKAAVVPAVAPTSKATPAPAAAK